MGGLPGGGRPELGPGGWRAECRRQALEAPSLRLDLSSAQGGGGGIAVPQGRGPAGPATSPGRARGSGFLGLCAGPPGPDAKALVHGWRLGSDPGLSSSSS